MANTTVQAGATPAPKSLAARFFGMITSPRATFESVVAHPKWFGMLALTMLIIIAGTTLPMTTEAGREALLDTQVRQMESFGMTVNDQMYEGMRAGIGRAPYTNAGFILVFGPIMAAMSAGVLFLVFNAIMGGRRRSSRCSRSSCTPGLSLRARCSSLQDRSTISAEP